MGLPSLTQSVAGLWVVVAVVVMAVVTQGALFSTRQGSRRERRWVRRTSLAPVVQSSVW